MVARSTELVESQEPGEPSVANPLKVACFDKACFFEDRVRNREMGELAKYSSVCMERRSSYEDRHANLCPFRGVTAEPTCSDSTPKAAKVASKVHVNHTGITPLSGQFCMYFLHDVVSQTPTLLSSRHFPFHQTSAVLTGLLSDWPVDQHFFQGFYLVLGVGQSSRRTVGPQNSAYPLGHTRTVGLTGHSSQRAYWFYTGPCQSGKQAA